VKEKLHAAEERLSNAQSRAEYEHAQLDQLLECDRTSSWIALLQYGIFGLLAAIVLGFLMYGVVNDKLISSLATIATARGLITFLITVITVAIALVLVLATVVSESPDRIQRFQHGKDLLTVLIGILGTIVGYYFGQSTDTAKGLNIAPVYISNHNRPAISQRESTEYGDHFPNSVLF
jgi:ABC-type uncharacterized transport system permease subunit